MASSEHLRAFIGNLITREPSGALCSATSARRTSVPHQCVRQPPSIFGCSPSIFGRSPEPSGSNQNLRVQNPFGAFAGLSTNVESFETRCTSRQLGRTSVLHPCGIIATECLRTLIGTLGFHPDLLEIQKPTFQSHRLAVIELFH